MSLPTNQSPAVSGESLRLEAVTVSVGFDDLIALVGHSMTLRAAMDGVGQ